MKEMLFIGAAVVLPWIIAWLLSVLPMGHRLGLAMLVACVTYFVDVNLLAELNYRGMSRSVNISTIDITVWGLLIFLLWQRRKRGSQWIASAQQPAVSPVIWMPALASAFALYIGVNIISLLGAVSLKYGAFDLIKLTRGFLMFWVATNLIRDDGIAEAMPRFLGLFVAIEVFYAAKDHMQGVYWVRATFEHKNGFAFAMNAVLPFLLARALLRHGQRFLYLGLYGAGVIAVIVSRSRTAWATMVMGAVIVIALGLFAVARRGTRGQLRRIGVILASMFLLALPFAVKMADGVIARWSESAEASADFRHTNNAIALELANTKVLGVGANQYVHALDTPVGDDLPEFDKIVAHNAYLLVAAETGWVGLGAFLALLLSFGILSVHMYARARTARAVYVSTGAIAALVMSMTHGTMESHGFLESHNYFIWCLLMGMVVGVARREGIGRVSIIAWLARRRARRMELRARAYRTRNGVRQRS